jgi:hypothetical protein
MMFCRPGVLVIVKLSKERCIFLIMGGKLSQTTRRHDWKKCGPLQPNKHSPPNQFYQRNKTLSIDTKPPKSNSLE